MAAKAKKSGRLAIYTRQDKAILFIGYVLLALFVVAIVVPVVYIVIASFMDPVTLQNQGITFDFSKWTLTAYERVATDAQIWTGFKNAVLYSVLFTVISWWSPCWRPTPCPCPISAAKRSSTPSLSSPCSSAAA